jgi:hypothetical protein
VCAEVCKACAVSCEDIGGMQHCVELCRRCAASCGQMSGASMSSRGPEAAGRRGSPPSGRA